MIAQIVVWVIYFIITLAGFVVVVAIVVSCGRLIGIEIPDAVFAIIGLAGAIPIGYYTANWSVNAINRRLPEKWQLPTDWP